MARFLITPSRSPNGEAIRRHGARGWSYAALQTTPSLERTSLRQRQGLLGAKAPAFLLDPDSALKIGLKAI
jgi:hypothetical protein